MINLLLSHLEILGTVFVQVATFEKDLTEMESLIATLGPLIPETNFTGGRTVLARYLCARDSQIYVSTASEQVQVSYL